MELLPFERFSNSRRNAMAITAQPKIPDRRTVEMKLPCKSITPVDLQNSPYRKEVWRAV
jgi:hypothetical protein